MTTNLSYTRLFWALTRTRSVLLSCRWSLPGSLPCLFAPVVPPAEHSITKSLAYVGLLDDRAGADVRFGQQPFAHEAGGQGNEKPNHQHDHGGGQIFDLPSRLQAIDHCLELQSKIGAKKFVDDQG